MKKYFTSTNIFGILLIWGATIGCCITPSNSLRAQVSNYGFSASIGVYTSLVAPTNVFPSGWDDNTAVSVPLGFTFTFNGTGYSSVFVHPNGYLTFTSSTSGYLPISGGSAATGVISAWGRDLQAQNTAPLGSVDYLSSGGVFTVQWSNTRRYNSTTINAERFEMQIQLIQATGNIKFVYGAWSDAVNAATANVGEVGLRGATGADFKNLSVVAGGNWSTPSLGLVNSATCFYNESSPATKPAPGLTYNFYADPVCAAPANQPSALILTPSASSISGSFTAAPSTPSNYLVVRTLTNVAPTPPTNGTNYLVGTTALGGTIISVNTTTTFTSTGLSPSTPYFFWVYSFNSACFAGPVYQVAAPLTGSTTTTACTISGTKTVGPTGNYLTLTAAIADLNINGLAGPVILDLQSTYLSTAEPAFPVVIPQLPCISAINNLTIRPQAGATALSITSANATGTLNFDGGDFVTIDGRAGGVGPTQLTLSNTALTGYTIQLINSATFNTFKFCTVSGVNTGTSSGVIYFNNAIGLTTGNSNNTIDNCELRDGATNPTNLIYSFGNTLDYGSQNISNVVSNCNLHDWFNATAIVTSAGLNIAGGSSDWTITGNSFYQTATRTFTMTTATEEGAIMITSAAFGYNFTVTNNFVGGSAPLCGGTPWTYTASATGLPIGKMIRLTAALGPFSNISGNTLTNISITSATVNNLSGLISHVSGNVNINGNTLGSQTLTGVVNFVLTNATAGVFFLPLGCGLGAAPCTMNVTNNNIGGITVNNSSTGSISFRVIYGQPVVGSISNYSNNIIGGTVTNSLQQLSNNIAHGLLFLGASNDGVFSNNTVRNITINNTGVTGSVVGVNVQTTGGRSTINNNTISNLSTNATNIAINNAASVVGLSMTSPLVGGNNVSGNVIFNLTNTNTTVAGWVNGMSFTAPLLPQAPTFVSKNFIHSLNLASVTGGMAGMISLSTGPYDFFNNMIRLGLDASGASITTSLQINGVFKANTGNVGTYFNTVYIGGSGVVSGAVNTFAYRRTSTGTLDSLVNNILYNARSNASGTGKHYAVGQNANTGLFENFNDLLADGTGGVLGLFVATDFTTLPTWQSGANMDFNSVSSDPKLINPTGNSATVDLHIQAASATPIERAALSLAQVPVDFDMQTRSTLTPEDIGADAGNFVLQDVTPPVINYTPLTNSCSTADRTLTGVNITDATGIPLAGLLVPRIYYRKNAGAYFSKPGTFVSGPATNSNWNFTIVVADMGGVVATDVISYYIIAQDIVGTPNIGSSPQGAIATDVNTVTTPPTAPNTFTILGTSLSGTYTVGVGGAFTTLTAAVTAYNSACLGGPVLFSLTDLTYPGETFPITVNANTFASAVNTLTIKPVLAGTSISGTSATAIIVLNGADWVTVDGSISNTANTVCPASAASRDLTITNTNVSTTSAVIWLQTVTTPLNSATNNTIKNLNLVGSGNTQTLIGVGSGSSAIGIASLGTSNNNNAYINNNISKVQYGIYSQGITLGAKNTGTIINQNLVNTVAPNNVRRAGVYVGFENNISISGNNISEIASATTVEDVFGIVLGGTNAISTSTVLGNEVTNATVTNNVIGSVRQTATYSACGLFLAPAFSGTNLIANNMMSGVSSNGTSGDFCIGMFLLGGNGSTTKIYYNTITMTSVPANTGASDKSFALGIVGVNPVVDLRNNILVNTQSNGTGNSYAVVYGYTPFTNLTSDHNDYFVSAGSQFFIGGTGSLVTPVNQATLANLQAITLKDSPGQNVLPLFASVTDLHLLSSSNQCIDGEGTPIPGITTDIDCQTRNATNPDIGADEFNNTTTIVLTITETSGLVNNDGTICAGATATITAPAGATSYLWSTGATTQSISPAPTTTTPYSVTVTNGACNDVASTTITVIPVPGLSNTVTQPTTCVSTDGAIDLTVTPAGTYNYDWADVAGTSNTEDRTGLMVGNYTVTVTNTATNCFSVLTVVLSGPGGCGVCPSIPNVSVNPSPACLSTTFTLTSTNLANMGNTYGIQFVYFLSATATPYTGGTLLATVANGSLTSGGTVATATASLSPTGTYFIYAILTPTPTDPICRPSATTTLIVNPLPTAGTTVAETSGIANNDGIICAGASVTITGTGGGTYVWSTGATTTSITVSPGSTQTYTVTVSSGNSGNSCTAVATRTITVNSLPTPFTVTGGGTYCAGGSGLAVGLSGSVTGVSYQLQLNAVNTGAPVAGTGAALNFGTFAGVGTYTVIGTSAATGCSGPMTGSVAIATTNCSTQLFDPCTCLNNATTLTNGQFAESIKVNAPSTQTWTVTAVNGLYLMSSPPPPASPIPIPLGTVLTNLGAGMNMFILNGIHIDAIGYTVTVSNAAGTSLTIGNSCQYPNPAITSDINGTYCLYSDPITLTGDPGDANIVSQVFTVNGVPATQFNPGAGIGQYLITYTVNGGVPKAFGPNDPGCIQSVSQYVNVITTPSTVACNDHVQISLGPDCEAEVVPSMILEGDVGCYDDYFVEIDKTLPYGDGPWVPPFLTSEDIGKTYGVRVTHLGNGNSCWGTINVEDKIPPVIECRPVTILCGEALPSEPAPTVEGYQNILLTGLNDLLEVNSFTYNFDFSYLPTATPVLDVDVRIKIDDHTFLPDLNVELIAPSGYTKSIFTIGGCTGQEWPINCVLDDDGATITLCLDLNAGDNVRLKPLQGGVSQPILFNFNGLDASGIWKVKISDIAAGDDGHVRAVGVFINVNLPPVAPTDNCGDVDLTFTDSQTGDPCEGLLVTRHWIATDQSGNTSACDQLITILPLVLDSVDCPAAFVGHCGESTDPSHTGWPSVNGTPITDDNNVCNIFVGFWDHELNDCGNGIKIVRTWTILDWCTQTTKECVQVIKLADDQAPIISCPSNLTVGTDFWYCYANVSVPKPTVTDACGSAWTLALTSTGGHIVNFGNNYVLNQLPLGTVTVTWTATDECGNHSSCSFTITVVDDVVPVANCDAHTVVALTNDGPFGITLVPAHVFDDGSYDNCGPVTFRARRMDSCIDFDWTTDGACVDDIPGGIPPVNSRDKGTVSRPCVPFACCDVGAGSIMVELEVTDAAGNRNFCMVEAVVQDKISPFVQCPPDITVSCDFWFNVQEGTFVDADGNNNGNLDEDPLSPVFGNMYDAFQYNDDESVRQDIIINDPGNPHVSHPHFWGIDGWADDNCEVNLQVRVKVTNDCSGDALPPGAPAGAVKLVERRFSASDGNQGIAPGTCTQRIWVVDFDPFFITDITCGLYNNDDVVWPCDVLLTSCPDDLGDTGEPIVYDDACSLIGVAYEDQRFEFVDGACFKILRTWSVIDWCQYNSLTGEGLWHYVQVIKVHDNEGPEFLNCPTGPVTLCVADEGVSLPANNQAFLGHDNPLSSSCSVHLNLCQAVHETCSDVVNYDVKLYLFNGDEFIYVKPLTSIATDSSHNANLCFDTRTNSIKQIRDNGIPYNSPFCGDYHKLLWSAEDGCGNWSHCEYLIRLEDCKQPSPVCINGLSTVVMPIGGQVTIWAKDFNASSFDDCTAEEDLLYSFSGTSYTPSFTYTCDNVPAFGVELAVEIWVADGGTDDNCNGQISWSERNKDFCTTTIVITDNAHVCPDTSGSSIILAGEILTPEHQKVEKVAINLTCPGTVFPVYVTSSDGAYTFSNIIPQTNYTVLPERNDNYMNGVSTLDLVRIQKHLLGIDPFSSPYDYIAADANNSQSVSAIDIVELRKLILGIYTELPANKSWRFVDKAFQFATPTHPWPFSEEIDVANMVSSEMDEDFVAIKVGDVNNSVKANAKQVLPRNDNGVISFFANDRTVTKGEMVDVAISSADFAAIEGYQFTLQTQGLEFRGAESGTINMSDDNMGVFGSTLTASWHKVGGVSATTSDVLFTLKFQATASGTLSSMMALNSKETQAEAYNTQDDIKSLKLTFRGAQHGAEFALYQNEPNPFKGNTVIGYDLPSASKVTLTLFDVTGKVLLVKDQESVKGYNTISVSSKSIPSVGVLYYRLDANEYTATKKMVIIE